MERIKYLCFLLLLLMSGTANLNAQKPELRFNSNKKFKIVQFTDVHWIYGNPGSDVAGERMNEVLNLEKPDFVIYTGDLIYGQPAKESLTEAIRPVVERGIPFAVTWGNHDDEQGMTRRELYDFIKDIPNNLTGTVEGLSGVTNYILPIKSADGTKDATVLYVFDTHAYSKLENVKGYDWVKTDQIAWYQQNSRTLTERNGGSPLPAIAFFHIPIPEYREAAADMANYLVGTRKEKACSPEINSGLGVALLEGGDVMATFVGHDHVNDYVTLWRGILLGYGRYTGGSTVYHNIPGGNGARIIELTEGERKLRTWIRVKGERIINEVYYPDDMK